MRAIVLGMGVSGMKAAALLEAKGYDVSCVDERSAEIVSDIPIFSSVREVDFEPSFAVASPGVAPDSPDYLSLLQNGVDVIGEAEFGLRYLKHRAIGVTGTNGKTTVTALITHILNEAGFSAVAIGNIGVPVSQFVLEDHPAETIAVVELSSFQLETMTSTVFEAACILNITPDHLDRHGTMEIYADTKKNIVKCVKPEGVVYVHESLKGDIHDPRAIFYGEGLVDFNEANQQAAALVCRRFGISDALIQKAMQTFKKHPHRMQCVATIDGVDWINDSKGTNTDAVVQAVLSLGLSQKGSIALIAGGYDKHIPFTPWIDIFCGRVSHIFAIGQTAQIIADELGPYIPVHICTTLAIAVAEAAKLSADEVSTILLSPGCSSYDQFNNYQERGEAFVSYVQELELTGKFS